MAARFTRFLVIVTSFLSSACCNCGGCGRGRPCCVWRTTSTPREEDDNSHRYRAGFQPRPPPQESTKLKSASHSFDTSTHTNTRMETCTRAQTKCWPGGGRQHASRGPPSPSVECRFQHGARRSRFLSCRSPLVWLFWASVRDEDHSAPRPGFWEGRRDRGGVVVCSTPNNTECFAGGSRTPPSLS